MRVFKLLSVLCLGIWMSACDNNQSLQEYYVENQDNKDFVAIDVPASLLANSESMDENQRRALETIKKINVLAIPQKSVNQDKIDIEKSNIAEILKDEKYQLLMRLGGGESRVEIYFTGNEEAVDEIIVYGFDDKKGMGIARVLGDDMNPSEIISMVKSFNEGDINMEGLSGITQMFQDTEK